MNFEKCLFWTVLFLIKPFGETFSISTRDAIMTQVPNPRESWFEKFVEYVTGKYPYFEIMRFFGADCSVRKNIFTIDQ